MKRDITPEDEAARFLKLRDEKGFTAFKWRVGEECGHDRTNGRAAPRRSCPMVRKALGDERDKLVDAQHLLLRPRRRSRSARLLESEGIGHFEEPCPYWEFD